MSFPAHDARKSVLCIDVGGRTQDALLFSVGDDPQNTYRTVLPAPGLLLARRIAACTESRRDVYLHGPNMGRSFFSAVTAHVQAGCRAALHPATAEALFGDVASVTSQGIALAETCPEGHVPLLTGDVDASLWRQLCSMAGVGSPSLIAVAARDHGRYPGGDARAGRMALWREWLHKWDAGGDGGGRGADPKALVFDSAPPELTRLAAIQALTGGPVADSATAALLGLLAMRDVAQRSHRHGVLLINAGNTHLTGFLVYKERVLGVYEQHSQGPDVDRIIKELADFRLGWLPTEEVERSGGHGSVFLDLPAEAEGFGPAYITGPKRRILEGHGRMTTPFDDAALTGCFGLLYGTGFLPAAS